MPTITGIKIEKGKPLPAELLKNVKVRLPFKGNNWKSDQGSELVESVSSEVKLKEKKSGADNKPKASEKFTRKDLEEISEKLGNFTEFKSWANKEFKVTGRSTKGLIKDILDVQSGKKEPELK